MGKGCTFVVHQIISASNKKGCSHIQICAIIMCDCKHRSTSAVWWKTRDVDQRSVAAIAVQFTLNCRVILAQCTGFYLYRYARYISQFQFREIESVVKDRKMENPHISDTRTVKRHVFIRAV